MAPIKPDQGYIERWTLNEKRQLLGQYRFYDNNCAEN